MKPIVIVGAGLSGLACAVTLQTHGREVLLLEASATVGGRVQTDTVDGFLLDRGFQVYLDAYPEAGDMPSRASTQMAASTKQSRSRAATRRSMPPTRNWPKSSLGRWRLTRNTSRTTLTCSSLSASLSASVTTPRTLLRTQSTPSRRWISATVATCLRATRSLWPHYPPGFLLL